jgi:hypothetical protein
MAEDRRWWDRDPVKVWAPLAAVVAAWLQTVAYAGYQAFYAAFDVRADEVGFDYTGTLRRSAVPIFISFVLALLVLSFLAVILPLVGRAMLVAGRDKERSRQLTQAYPGRAERQAVLLVVWIVFMVVVAWLTQGVVTLAGSGAVTAGLLALDALRSRARDEPSTLSLFLEPRRQRGLRHLLVLVLATAVGAGVRDWRLLPLFAIGLYWADRTFSAETADRAPSFWERVRLVPLGFVSAATVLLVAGLALGLVSQLDWTLRAAHLDRKLRQVHAGQALSFEPFAPFGLIQPQALAVV